MKTLFKYKKSQAEIPGKMIFYIFFAFLLVILFGVVFGWAYSTISLKAEIPKSVEPNIFKQRFLNSPDCFALPDPYSGRTFPRTLDWGRFNEQNLRYCYDPADIKEALAFRLMLKNIQLGQKQATTKNWNPSKSVERLESGRVRIFANGDYYEGELITEFQR